MDKKIKSFIKRHFVVMWIVIVCLTLSYMVVMAAYPTKQNKAKKVVSLQSQSEIQFSSNYLEETVLYKTVVINDGDPITVDIRNFSKNNSTKWYLSDICRTDRFGGFGYHEQFSDWRWSSQCIQCQHYHC